MREPRITVLMPVYNGARYLRESIDSILSQTFTDFEFIIIDDGSTDTTAAIIKSYRDTRIRFIQNSENLGLVKTLNLGLGLAQGEYIARQDSDDISSPERLSLQKTFLDVHPEVPLLGSLGELIDERGDIISPITRPTDAPAVKWRLLVNCCLLHTSVMFRKNVIRDLGGYSPEYEKAAEDFDLWSRVSQRHPVAQLPQALVKRRKHAACLTSSTVHVAKMDAMTLKIVRKNIEQLLRRAVPPELVRDIVYADDIRSSDPGHFRTVAALLEEILQTFQAAGNPANAWIIRDHAMKMRCVVSGYCNRTRKGAWSMLSRLVRPAQGIYELPGLAICLLKLLLGPKLVARILRMRPSQGAH